MIESARSSSRKVSNYDELKKIVLYKDPSKLYDRYQVFPTKLLDKMDDHYPVMFDYARYQKEKLKKIVRQKKQYSQSSQNSPIQQQKEHSQSPTSSNNQRFKLIREARADITQGKSQSILMNHIKEKTNQNIKDIMQMNASLYDQFQKKNMKTQKNQSQTEFVQNFSDMQRRITRKQSKFDYPLPLSNS